LDFVIPVFVGHIPVGQDDNAGRESFPPSPLFRTADFEVDIVSIFEPFVKAALKSIGPLGIVFDNFLEVIKELAVGIDASNFNVGPRMAEEISPKESDGLKFHQAGN
jgi:hypothetical protein